MTVGLTHGRLPPDQLLNLAEKLLNDLQDARDRQNQTPQNSSRPSGSYAPWEQAQFSDGKGQTETTDSNEDTEEKQSEKRQPVAESSGADTEKKPEVAKNRKPGKKIGAKGFGRTEKLPLTGEEVHKADQCAGCGQEFGIDEPFERRTGSYTLDIKKVEFGLEVTNVLYIYGAKGRGCGHWTESEHGRCEREEGWEVEITEWHLIGPTLASLIICLSLGMRQSRPRIREFLADWLGISVSKGSISKCLCRKITGVGSVTS